MKVFPTLKHAGIAGILTGLFLIGEITFLMISGFTPDKVNNPATALTFLRDNVVPLRTAAIFGALGTVVRMIFIAGLAEKLRAKTPTQAASVLYFGISGGIGHGLVSLSFYVGFPMFIALMESNPTLAMNSWPAFNAIAVGYQAFGNFLIGLMFFTAGWAIVAGKTMPKIIGWTGIFAGIASVTSVLTTGTPFASIGFIAFIPSLILAMIFDIGSGITLLKSKEVL